MGQTFLFITVKKLNPVPRFSAKVLTLINFRSLLYKFMFERLPIEFFSVKSNINPGYSLFCPSEFE